MTPVQVRPDAANFFMLTPGNYVKTGRGLYYNDPICRWLVLDTGEILKVLKGNPLTVERSGFSPDRFQAQLDRGNIIPVPHNE